MTQPTTGLLRPRFFDRQQLAAADLNQGQHYLRERLRLHNRFLHGWGVVCGAGVATAADPWSVQVGAGYVITPHGDEVYLPDGLPPYHLEAAARLCLALDAPCDDPADLGDLPVKIRSGNLDPVGKDVHRDYNREWIELQVLRTGSLNGYVVQHTVNPGTATQGFASYYVFQEATAFPQGARIRIHSGSQAAHAEPEPGVVHRYLATAGQVGNWRLNNREDTVRILNPAGAVVHTRTLVRSVVYLVVYPAEVELCPQPAVPAQCQPPGGSYAYSRIRDSQRFDIVCAQPPSHLQALTCSQLEAIVCGRVPAPCPPALDAGDNGVVLAALTVSADGVIAVDDQSVRRQLLSEAILQEYVRCRCTEPPPPPGRIDAIAPAAATVSAGQALELDAEILGDGLAGATQVLFAGSGVSADVVDNSDPARLRIRLRLAAEVQSGAYAFVVIFPDARPALASAAFGVAFQVTAIAPTVFTLPTRPTLFTDFTIFTRPTLFTDLVVTLPTLFTDLVFTRPSLFTDLVTLPTLFSDILVSRPPLDLDPILFDVDRGATLPVTSVGGIGAVRADRLRAEGVNSVLDLATMPVTDAARVLGVSEVRVAAIQDEARRLMRRP